MQDSISLNCDAVVLRFIAGYKLNTKLRLSYIFLVKCIFPLGNSSYCFGYSR